MDNFDCHTLLKDSVVLKKLKKKKNVVFFFYLKGFDTFKGFFSPGFSL